MSSNHIEKAIEQTLIIGSSSLLKPISEGEDYLNGFYSGEELTEKQNEYKNRLCGLTGWNLALYIVMQSEDDTHRVVVLEKTLSHLDALHYSNIFKVVMKELSRFEDPDAQVLSYNWVCAPKTIDFSKQEDEILKWFERYGSFSSEHQDNSLTILKLAEKLNVSPLNLK